MRVALIVVVAVALLAMPVRAHGHSHDHDHDDHGDHERHGHSHSHDGHDYDSSADERSDTVGAQGGWLSSLRWIAEWVLLLVIAGLVIKIASLMLCPAKPRVAVPYKPKRKPMKVFLTIDELKRYDGSDPSLPVLIGVRGVLYDVSARRDLYGVKGQGYNVLAGHDASRALAKHKLDLETVVDNNIDDLTPGELEALSSWEDSYKAKYDVAGEIVKSEEERQQKAAEERKRYDAETARLASEEAAKAKAKM